ncbi:hypothetical protein IQ17_05793 [Bradyrhizobium daqingense]|uniref:Uncharacterized protein n=1 Tax=Bradyrhizobium daqingense TaxID=993502 RepID=A0A562KTV5_9BRAD|nr:hypothetical protein IQ17_05793 [Bradyrhizobium daqingense]
MAHGDYLLVWIMRAENAAGGHDLRCAKHVLSLLVKEDVRA